MGMSMSGSWNDFVSSPILMGSVGAEAILEKKASALYLRTAVILRLPLAL